MSLHAKPSPETLIRLERQRRINSISSVVIALLVITLIGTILAVILLPSFIRETPTIVTYQTSTTETTEPEVRKVQTSMERKPSSPSSAMAKVIAASTVSEVSIPVPDDIPDAPSLSFGDGDDFGSGWGDGFGSGDGGGGASFFQQSVKADRVAYVIDFSLSMRGERERLMRKELKKSLKSLSTGMEYQMVFFAGPAWVAGSKVVSDNKAKATVTGERKSDKFEWVGLGNAHSWEAKGKKQPVEWLSVSSSQINEAVRIVEETPLVWGTIWGPALEMAMEMEPAPQVIFFMTDGQTSNSDEEESKKLAQRAKSKRITINTVAMMEPRAHEGMKRLAKITGGQFTVIEQNGKARKVPLD